ncbi:MAG: hypothetical protein KKE37_01875 [Verrucomicrobia bacterium]|nr:hypothetical protein [Verrucomicrobiota bacterium]MBU4290045.1 hypothetical protein [Verrucomicrobiota bacterium]MBU4428084.1 hypothetical protein [Verrucomicrobiota bacterium]MCG2679585.1 hypothetical protein [Kiritimatiellia bacterium]
MMPRQLLEVENGLPTIWLAIKNVLQDQRISNVTHLAQCLSVDVAMVREGLVYWLNCGTVEVLHPYNHHPPFDDELDYYRWKQDNDQDFLWEQELLVR